MNKLPRALVMWLYEVHRVVLSTRQSLVPRRVLWGKVQFSSPNRKCALSHAP